MENQANSKSIILNNGVILGVASIVLSLVMYATGNHLDPHWSISIVSVALFLGLIIYGTKKFKEANEGFMSWGEGVKVGVGIAIVAGLIVVIYNYIFMNFIEPDLMSQMTEVQNQKFLDEGMTEEQIEAANEIGKSFQTPGIMAAMGIISYAIGGFIVAAITSAIMKKSEEETY
jgi:FtsH-binding integral membrane protein